jgi:hypothetical protein
MNIALHRNAFAAALVTAVIAPVACSRNTDDHAKASRPSEPHSYASTTAEERRMDERLAQDRAEEQRLEQRLADDRAEERRLDDRLAEERSRELRSIGGGPTASSASAAALDRIAGARCDREVRCGNIGSHGKYTSRQECMNKTRDDERDDISAKECPGGINERTLDECLQTLRTDDCGNSLDHIDRRNACRTSRLCVK